MDLTHIQPVHPETLSFLADEAGFDHVGVRYVSPARPPHEPIEIPDDAPAWAAVAGKATDDELQALTDTVFGPQDYALIAKVG